MLPALLLAGCGGGSHSGADSATSRAALGAGLSPHPSAKLKKQEEAVHRQVLASLHHVSHAKYGGLPKDLRSKQKAPANQILSASPGHPASPIQGVAVHLHLPHGSALAIVVGPFVPIKDQGSFHNYTKPHWKMTFSDVHGTVPISKAALTITDEQGTVLRPTVTGPGGSSIPSDVPGGKPYTLTLGGVRTSIGDGKVLYTPSGHLLSEWDFGAETD